VRRLWKLVYHHVEAGAPVELIITDLNETQQAIRHSVHSTLAKVSDDVGRRYTFNTAIAANMELMNTLSRFDDDSEQGRAVMQEALDAVVLMLSPIVPHITHTLWSVLGHQQAIVDCAWPAVDERALVQASIALVVQVNGKVRGRINVAADAPREVIEAAVMGEDNVQKYIADKPVRKIIVVPGKLVNVVV
jgi:leucyl-tRNA synthetase